MVNASIENLDFGSETVGHEPLTATERSGIISEDPRDARELMTGALRALSS
jgi:hypothetical protein